MNLPKLFLIKIRLQLIALFLFGILILQIFFCYPLYSQPIEPKTIAIVLNLTNGHFGKIESDSLKAGVELGSEYVKTLLEKNNVRLEYFDDKGTVEGAINVGKTLSKRDDVAIILSGYSSTSVPLANYVKNKVFLTMFSSAKEVVVNPKLHARLISDNDLQGLKMMEFAQKKFSPGKACVIIESDDGFSISVKLGLIGASKKLSKLKSLNFYSYRGYQEGEIIHSLLSCLKTKPDVIFHSGRSDSVRLLLNFYLKNDIRIPIIGSDGWGDHSLILEGENRTLLARHKTPLFLAYFWDVVARNKLQETFKKLMMTRYHRVDVLMPLGQDAVVIALSLILSNRINEFESLEQTINHLKPVAPLVLLQSGDFIKIPLRHSIYRLYPDWFH